MLFIFVSIPMLSPGASIASATPSSSESAAAKYSVATSRQSEVEKLRYLPIAAADALDPSENLVPHFELYLIDQLMQREGLDAMDPVVLNERRVLAVDQVWTSISFEKYVMVKFGFLPVESAHLEKLIPMGQGFLFHTKTSLTQTPVAFYFSGFDRGELTQFKKLIQKLNSDQENVDNGANTKYLRASLVNKINLFFFCGLCSNFAKYLATIFSTIQSTPHSIP